MFLRNEEASLNPKSCSTKSIEADLNRRKFLSQASASLAGASLLPQAFAQQSPAEVTLGIGAAGCTTPADFTGLSYESPQLSNPDFFSTANTQLVDLYRGLSSSGVLRLGGNLSDFTFWGGPGAPALSPDQQTAIAKAKNYFEWILVDPIARKDLRSITTPAAVRNLRGFLDATGWTLLYGINFGSGTPEQAAVEAAAVQEIIGPKLIAFQIGNECDFFAGGRRPKPWDFDHYWADYSRFVKAIRERTPGARFAGPDVAIRTDWVVDYSKAAKGDAVLLSKHHYAMGPAGDPRMNAAHLLGLDDDLTEQTATLLAASQASGIPCRFTEINSCFHGGQPGVSDAYASALWGADFMLQLAQAGIAGVNLHGGGVGIYSPIVGDAATGITARPLYYGMQFAQKFAGATFLNTTLAGGTQNFSAYAARKGNIRMLALINKDSSARRVSLHNTSLQHHQCTDILNLTAPELDSKSEIALKQAPLDTIPKKDLKSLLIDPYSAQLLYFT